MGDWLGFLFSFNNKRIVTFLANCSTGKQRGSYLVVGGEGSLVLVPLLPERCPLPALGMTPAPSGGPCSLPDLGCWPGLLQTAAQFRKPA